MAICAHSTPAALPLYPVSRWISGARALTRPEAESLVEGLIDMLDRFDGDTDHEHEEPEASAMEWASNGAHRFNMGLAA